MIGFNCNDFMQHKTGNQYDCIKLQSIAKYVVGFDAVIVLYMCLSGTDGCSVHQHHGVHHEGS